jgi:ribosomal-protein-alanine N-acetyltransferase
MIIIGGDQMIASSRLRLRKFSAADITPAYKNWGSDRKAIKKVDFTLDASFKEFEDFVIGIITEYADPCLDFVIERLEDGAIIGAAQLRASSGECELGFILGAKFWGKGYGSEAADALIRYAFREAGFSKVKARCEINNAASEKILSRRLVYKGVVKKGVTKRKKQSDAKYYEMTTEEYFYVYGE